MPRPVSQFATRVAYGAQQLSRVAWYVGHGKTMQRLFEQTRRGTRQRTRQRAHDAGSGPGRWKHYADMAALFRQDLANVEAGIYPIPQDHDGPLPALLNRSRLFFEDLPEVHRRRERGEVRQVASADTKGKRPAYYLQNFHFQTGGWMTRDSALRYDTQVEVLFKGTANAIRRQALPPIHELFAGRDQRQLRFLDVGCGTGRFLHFFKQAWPRLPAVGIDMSEAYLEEARRHLRGWCWTSLILANAEAIPLRDESQHAVASIFLFHELPPKVRHLVFREFARLLKPGGRLVVLDSLQTGDCPDYDGILERFPRNYHEPYYASYLGEDFRSMAEAHGLRLRRQANAFVSKVMVFDKP
jgi:ubiquinone/menaquinone biosynthesis C-methylase UbiE